LCEIQVALQKYSWFCGKVVFDGFNKRIFSLRLCASAVNYYNELRSSYWSGNTRPAGDEVENLLGREHGLWRRAEYTGLCG
jgi:hypothetical protein